MSTPRGADGHKRGRAGRAARSAAQPAARSAASVRAVRQERRPLTNIGGSAERSGEPALAELLARALEVEARLAGRAAIGVDANPLAVRLARLKVGGATEGERSRLVAAAREVAAAADGRREARAGSSRRYGPEDVTLFDGG